MSNDFRSRLLKAKSGVNAPSYKRVFLGSGGREFRLRFLDPKLIDGEGAPFSYVYLHGGFKHPNYPDQTYPSNFRCGGKGCALCEVAREMGKEEKDNNVPRDQKKAWRMQARKYAIYWAINRENNEISLVHVPDSSFNKDEETLNQVLSNKLLELDEMGLTPFDLKDGMDIVITSQAVDKKVKFSINEDSQSIGPVEEMIAKKFRNMKPLSQVYKQYSKEDLASIARGEKIVYGEAKQEQHAQEEKRKVETEERSISEENFAPKETSSFEDDLLLGDVDTSHLSTDSAPSNTSLAERLKKLKYSGSEDN